MDDFGTGYSSLDTLHSFPFDKIKIDKSFLLESEHNEQARAIIRAVLALGKSLQIPVLAEGVETIGQLELLVSAGCEEAQGITSASRPWLPACPCKVQRRDSAWGHRERDGRDGRGNGQVGLARHATSA
jgi:EAL domain-containing protein (putative c-di-GMP-specific phosphodiesterase class I)